MLFLPEQGELVLEPNASEGDGDQLAGVASSPET
jgi:hypothetical protein